MADYYTSFSVHLPVGAGNADAALALYAELRDELVAKNEAIGFEANRNDPDDGTVWLWDISGSGDPEHVITYALQCAKTFFLTGLWGFHWGNSCSRARLDGFGGGAHLLNLGRCETVDWLDTELWLMQRTGAGEQRAVAAETILDPVAAAQGWTETTQLGVLLGFLDKLIDANPYIAEQLRADLAEVAGAPNALQCSECGEPMFIAASGTSHHVGADPDGIDHDRDLDHTAFAEHGDAAMSSCEHASVAKVQPDAAKTTRIGRWYATGPDDRPFAPDDPAFHVYRVVADGPVPGCVTVENAAGQRFPVPVSLVDAIVAPSRRATEQAARLSGRARGAAIMTVCRYLDASSGHLSVATWAWLDAITTDDVVRDPRNPNAEILGGRTRHGWFVWASEAPPATVPADLAALMRLVRQRECEFLLLDCDALPMEELPVLHPDFPGAFKPG